ncbi:MAG: hypothetical protein JKY65_18415 [Planctomycetes bacterium]|nr:hypothetical protein [Planctomycetota bacterium]
MLGKGSRALQPSPAQHGLGLAEIDREAGRSRAFLSAAFKGRKRGPKAARSWTRIEAWVKAEKAA